MKIFEKIKERIDLELVLIALAFSAIVSIIVLGPEMKLNFAMPWFAIHIGIVIAVFVAILVGGSLLEQKMAKRFQNELKGDKKE